MIHRSYLFVFIQSFCLGSFVLLHVVLFVRAIAIIPYHWLWVVDLWKKYYSETNCSCIPFYILSVKSHFFRCRIHLPLCRRVLFFWTFQMHSPLLPPQSWPLWAWNHSRIRGHHPDCRVPTLLRESKFNWSWKIRQSHCDLKPLPKLLHKKTNRLTINQLQRSKIKLKQNLTRLLKFTFRYLLYVRALNFILFVDTTIVILFVCHLFIYFNFLCLFIL